MKGQLKIDQIFTFIAKNKDGTEGVVACSSPTGDAR